MKTQSLQASGPSRSDFPWPDAVTVQLAEWLHKSVTEKAGIIGAMEIEVARLKEMMTEVTVTEKASMEFNEGLLNGKPVVVVRSGIGKVNAGICKSAPRFSWTSSASTA